MATFHKFMRAIIERAGCEAQSDRSTTIEAEHVLLAIAAQPDTTPAKILNSVGLDHGAIREALNREFEHSLSAAGVSLGAFDLPRASTAPERATNVGASARIALERAFTGVRRNPRPAHVLLGILQAEVGTVPRALALAGVDRDELMGRVRQAISQD